MDNVSINYYYFIILKYFITWKIEPNLRTQNKIYTVELLFA